MKFFLATLMTLAFIAAPLAQTAAAAPDPVTLARAHVSISSDGLFVIDGHVAGRDRQVLQAIFEPLNAQLSAVAPELRLTTQRVHAGKGPGLGARAAMMCALVPKYAFQALAWYLIITGAVVSVLGAAADVTVLGIPAGILFGAVGATVGLSGTYFLDLVNQTVPDWGKWVCW